MSKASLSAMVRHCQKRLRPATFNDYDGAANGLQVENSGAVTKIAAAVDGSPATVNMAAAARADLLIVHHGLFVGVKSKIADVLEKESPPPVAVHS